MAKQPMKPAKPSGNAKPQPKPGKPSKGGYGKGY